MTGPIVRFHPDVERKLHGCPVSAEPAVGSPVARFGGVGLVADNRVPSGLIVPVRVGEQGEGDLGVLIFDAIRGGLAVRLQPERVGTGAGGGVDPG